MTLAEYADALDMQIVITRYPNQNNRWSARFPNCELKVGSMLSSATGEGKSPNAALDALARELSGQRVVFNAGNDRRRECVVPTLDV
jgi:hypothetical protein